MGRTTGRTEKRVLIEQSKAYRRAGGPARSSWWLVAKDDDGPLEALTLEAGDTLPVFSGRGEAELFLWLREARKDGWEAHESSAEELAFVLSGPYAGVGFVALDPSAEIFDAQAAESTGLSREGFLEWIVSRSL